MPTAAPSLTHPQSILTFAVRGLDRATVHVDDVANGKACGCQCPDCGEPLIARQGERNTHSFAHVAESDCKGGLETALHLAAKVVLLRAGRIVLAGLEVTESVEDLRGQAHTASASLGAQDVVLTDIAEEVRFGGLFGVKPDIVAKVEGRQLFVEVAVTSFADKAKRQKLAADGYATIEIDLSGMAGDWDWAKLTQVVVQETQKKGWLFDPREAALRDKARAEAQALADAANRQRGETAAKPGNSGGATDARSRAREAAVALARAHNLRHGVDIGDRFQWADSSRWPAPGAARQLALELSDGASLRNVDIGWGRLAGLTSAVQVLSIDEVVWFFRVDIQPARVFAYLQQAGIIRQG